MHNLVGNFKDRFSRDVAQIYLDQIEVGGTIHSALILIQSSKNGFTSKASRSYNM